MSETSRCPACGAPVTPYARKTGHCEFCNTAMPAIREELIPDAFAAATTPEVITPPLYTTQSVTNGQRAASNGDVQDVVSQVRSAVNASQVGTKIRNLIILAVLGFIMTCALCVGLFMIVRNGQ